MSHRAVCSIALLAALSAAIVARAESSESEASQTDLMRRVDAFVRAIARPGSAEETSLVRWNSSICLLVAGLTKEDSKLVTNRISQISSFSGALLAHSPCQPNFIVVATSEPDRVLEAWYSRNRQLFGDASHSQISHFLERSRSRPVSVWYNIEPGRKSSTRNGHFIPSDTRAQSSAFTGNSAADFLSFFAIIDTRRMQGTMMVQLADYVAMAGLACVDLDADLGSAPTILQLFAPSAEARPSGLSSWDAAFLRALYQSNQTSRTQRFDIAARITQEISREHIATN